MRDDVPPQPRERSKGWGPPRCSEGAAGHPLGIRDLCIEHSASGQPQAFQGFPVAQPWLGGSRAMRSKRPGTLRPLVTKL